MTFLSIGFFSGETLGLSCCCWSALFTLCVGAEEPLKQDKLDCSFLEPDGVLGRQEEAVQALSLLCDVSREVLIVLDACGCSSFALSAFTVKVLFEESQVLVACNADLLYAPTFSAVGLPVEDRSAPANVLEEEHGRGIELLLESFL